VVEDNPADFRLLPAALSLHGFTGKIRMISDGEQAINPIDEVDGRDESAVPA